MQRYPVLNLRRLGQLSLIEQSMAGYQRSLSNLEDLSKQLLDTSREAVLKQAKDCRDLVQEMKDLPEAALPDAEKMVDKCVADLKGLLDKGIAEMRSGPQINQEKPSDSSALAYVGAGVVTLAIAIPLLI